MSLNSPFELPASASLAADTLSGSAPPRETLSHYLTCPSSEARAKLLEILTIRSFARRKVTLASGRESDFYIDVKQTALHALGSLLLGRLLFELLEQRQESGLGVVAAGGLTLGADPLATSVSVFSALRGRPIDAFIVRKEPKGHGTGQWIEGLKTIPDGAPVAILEDVATTGGSALTAIDRVLLRGLTVARVVSVVDRLEGAQAAFEARGFKLESLFTRDDFMGKSP